MKHGNALDAWIRSKDRGAGAQLAAALGETQQVLNHWLSRGVPPHRCLAVAEATGLSVKKLRPNDWANYWPSAAAKAKA